MPYGSLTVNTADTELADDQILVSADWNLPADLKAALLATGKFAAIGRRLPAGFGIGALWRIRCPELLAQIQRARCAVRRPARSRHGLALA